MAGPKDEFFDLDKHTRDAFFFWLKIADSVSGGAFKRGYRPPTPQERISEWDSLTSEQRDIIEQRKGSDWLMQQGAQVERLRRQMPQAAIT